MIESKMELFKSVERETKTKAYSKEGLTINKQDPEVVRKKRSMDWVQRQIKILNEENEKREAEIESLQVLNQSLVVCYYILCLSNKFMLVDGWQKEETRSGQKEQI